MSAHKSMPIVINGEQHDTHRLDLDYQYGIAVIDVNLGHLVGHEVTLRVGAGPWLTGSATVTEVHVPKDQPAYCVLSLHGPLMKEKAA